MQLSVCRSFQLLACQATVLDRDRGLDVLVLIERDGPVLQHRLPEPAVREAAVMALTGAEHFLDVGNRFIHIALAPSKFHVVDARRS